MKQRTKLFALDIIQLVESLPQGRTSEVLGRQLLRSGTSIRIKLSERLPIQVHRRLYFQDGHC